MAERLNGAQQITTGRRVHEFEIMDPDGGGNGMPVTGTGDRHMHVIFQPRRVHEFEIMDPDGGGNGGGIIGVGALDPYIKADRAMIRKR